MKAYFLDAIAVQTASATSATLIVGARSYVATCLGDGIITRSSFGRTASLPPLKKNVTWAYFSVCVQQSLIDPHYNRYRVTDLCYMSLSKVAGCHDFR